MIYDKEGNTTIVYQEKPALPIFIKNLTEGYHQVANDHLIINLFTFTDLKADDLLEFLELSNAHRQKGKSFVMVTDKITYEDVPEDLVVTPTLQEARDIVEMEEIERDLGI
jgi:hypothetical protein